MKKLSTAEVKQTKNCPAQKLTHGWRGSTPSCCVR